MGVGIVLGAGGPVGWAYHLGVLEGIRSAIGREPADADALVGTSAGGAIAATLLAGSTTEEVLASISEPPTAEQRAEMMKAFQTRRRRPWRFLVPQSPALVRRGGVVGLAGLLPTGLFPTAPLRRFPVAGLDGWPDRLWIPAVRLRDGQVVVFGRDRTDVPLADALEATSAVPAMFRPKRIGDERFIDGAVASATHADLLVDWGTDRRVDRGTDHRADRGTDHRVDRGTDRSVDRGTERALDRVLISSPMTRPGRGLIRSRARRQLEAEAERLRRAGTSVLIVSPDEAVMELAQGFPRTNREAGPAIVAAARRQTEAAFAAARSPR